MLQIAPLNWHLIAIPSQMFLDVVDSQNKSISFFQDDPLTSIETFAIITRECNQPFLGNWSLIWIFDGDRIENPILFHSISSN